MQEILTALPHFGIQDDYVGKDIFPCFILQCPQPSSLYELLELNSSMSCIIHTFTLLCYLFYFILLWLPQIINNRFQPHFCLVQHKVSLWDTAMTQAPWHTSLQHYL